MIKEYDTTITEKLFSVDRFKEGKEYEKEIEKAEKLYEKAQIILKECDNQQVFDNWFSYLKNNIHNKKDAWNFMMSFFDYDGHNIKVKDPYPFLGLLFNRLGLSLDAEPFKGEEETMFDTFDSIYVSLLIKSGIIKKDDYFYVNLYSDDRFKKAVEENK